MTDHISLGGDVWKKAFATTSPPMLYLMIKFHVKVVDADGDDEGALEDDEADCGLENDAPRYSSPQA